MQCSKTKVAQESKTYLTKYTRMVCNLYVDSDLNQPFRSNHYLQKVSPADHHYQHQQFDTSNANLNHIRVNLNLIAFNRLRQTCVCVCALALFLVSTMVSVSAI